MKKTFAIAISMAFIGSFLSAPAFGAAKPGATCSKAGVTSIISGKKYTCTKSGRKLVWDKGTLIEKATSASTGNNSANASTPVNAINPTSAVLGGPCNGFEGKSIINSEGQSLLCKVEIDGNTHWVSTGLTQAFPATQDKNDSNNVPTLVSSAVSTCKIQDSRSTKIQPNNIGFPHTTDLFPVQGEIKIAFIPVDFTDAPGVTDPYVNSNATFLKMKDWYTYFSNGKIALQAQQSHQWFHSSRKSADIQNLHPTGSANTTQSLADSLAQEWIDSTGDNFNFMGVTAIFFDFPSTVKGMGEGTQGRYGSQGLGVVFNTKQGKISSFYNTTGDYWFRDDGGATATQKQNHQWSYYIHEMLHSTGLALHAPGNGFPISLATQQTGTPQGFSGILDVWELFLLGWLNDEQIFCTSKSELSSGSISLTPIDEKTNGVKAGIVALSSTKAIVVQSRRPVDWSSELPSQATGLNIYVVDTSMDNDRTHESSGDTGNQPEYSKWAYLQLPDGVPGGPSIRRNFTDYFIQKGQSVTVDGVKVTLIDSGKKDVVRIEKTK
jgi:hypothetical protein